MKLNSLVKINKTNEKLWMILAETQVANGLYKQALNSLNQAENLNSNIREIYFAKSNIYWKQCRRNRRRKRYLLRQTRWAWNPA